MTNTNNSMASALGIALESKEQEEEAVREALVPTVVQSDAQKSEADAEHARGVLYNSLERSTAAVEQVAEIARESMEPRAFNTLSDLLKTQADIATKLLKVRADLQLVQNNAINLQNNLKNVKSNEDDEIPMNSRDVLVLFKKKG